MKKNRIILLFSLPILFLIGFTLLPSGVDLKDSLRILKSRHFSDFKKVENFPDLHLNIN